MADQIHILTWCNFHGIDEQGNEHTGNLNLNFVHWSLCVVDSENLRHETYSWSWSRDDEL